MQSSLNCVCDGNGRYPWVWMQGFVSFQHPPAPYGSTDTRGHTRAVRWALLKTTIGFNSWCPVNSPPPPPLCISSFVTRQQVRDPAKLHPWWGTAGPKTKKASGIRGQTQHRPISSPQFELEDVEPAPPSGSNNSQVAPGIDETSQRWFLIQALTQRPRSSHLCFSLWLTSPSLQPSAKRHLHLLSPSALPQPWNLRSQCRCAGPHYRGPPPISFPAQSFRSSPPSRMILCPGGADFSSMKFSPLALCWFQRDCLPQLPCPPLLDPGIQLLLPPLPPFALLLHFPVPCVTLSAGKQCLKALWSTRWLC